MKTEFGYFHHREIEIPTAAVDDCAQPGRNDEAVEFWQPKIIFDFTRDEKIDGLKEYGAWSQEELTALTDDELEQKILWILCHEIKENREGES